MRQWPVAGAIMENGGLHFAWRGARLVKSYPQPEKQRVEDRKRLHAHVRAALEHVPGAQLSSDSLYTEVDLAIDYAEDVDLGQGAAAKLEAFLYSGGIAGAAGAAYGLLFGYMGSTFASIQYSIEVLLFTLLGGAGTLLGPLIGVVLMMTLIDQLSEITSAYLLVIGVVLIALVLWFPKGILGSIRERWLPWLM